MTNPIQKIAPPALPQASDDYIRAVQDQKDNVLRLFFNRLTSAINSLLDPNYGGAALYFPYGAFSSTVNQTAASTTAAYVVTFNNTDASLGVSVVSNSRLTVQNAGLYNLQFSIQLANTDTQIHDVDIWARVNGVDAPNTNSTFSVTSRHGGVDGQMIAALNLYVNLEVNNYVELVWHTSNTSCYFKYAPAGTLPTRPVTPFSDRYAELCE